MGMAEKSFSMVARMAVDCMSWCLHGTSASEALLLLSTSALSIDTLLDIELEIENRYAIRDQCSVPITRLSIIEILTMLSDSRAFQFDGHKTVIGNHGASNHPCLTRDIASDFPCKSNSYITTKT